MPVDLPMLANRYALKLMLTESDFIQILNEELGLIIAHVMGVIGTETQAEEIQHVVLTGVSVRIPGVKRRIRETFRSAHVHCEIAPE